MSGKECQDDAQACRKSWEPPVIMRIGTDEAEAGDNGGGVDGDTTKS